MSESSRTKGWQIPETSGTTAGIRRVWTVLLSLALLAAIAWFVYWTFKPVRPLNVHFAQMVVQGYSSEAGLMDPAFAGSGIVDLTSESAEERRLKNWRLHGLLDKRSEDVTLSQVLGGLTESMEAAGSREDIDVLFLYVSAHGLVVGDQPVLLASNYDYASNDQSGNIPMGEFLNEVAKLPALHCVVLLDASHIDSHLRHGVLANGFLGELEKVVRDEVPDNVWLVTGNAMLQPSHVSSISSRSLFSTAIADSWTRQSDKRGINDPNPDGQLSLGEFYEAVLAYSFSQSSGALQTPLLMRGGAGLCSSVDHEIYQRAESIIVSDLLPPIDKKKRKESAKKQASRPTSPVDLFAAVRGRQLALVSPQPPTSGEEGRSDGDSKPAAEEEETHEDGKPAEATSTDRGSAESSGGSSDVGPPVDPRPTDPLALAWWYRDRLTERTTLKWSPVDFAPHYWRAVNDQLTRLEHLQRYSGGRAVALENDIAALVESLGQLYDAMNDNVAVAEANDENTAYAAVQTCLAWNYFLKNHSSVKNQWEDESSWSAAQLPKWLSTQRAIRDYLDTSFELADWIQLYEVAGRGMVQSGNLFDRTVDLTAVLRRHQLLMEQPQYELDRATSELVAAAREITEARRALTDILGREVLVLIDKDNESAGTWNWEYRVSRLLQSPLLSFGQRASLKRRLSEASVKPLTLLKASEAWNAINNSGTTWQHVINTSKLLKGAGDFYCPNREGAPAPRPTSRGTWEGANRFSKEYARWLVELSESPPQGNSMENWRWANQLHPHETGSISVRDTRGGFVTAIIAAPNNSGLILQFADQKFIRASTMPVVAQSLAKPIDNVYIDVKTQGSLERVERCRLKVESPSAGALSNAFQLRVGGSPIEFNRDTEVSLDDGELTVSIRALRDRSDTDDQFQVELSVSTLDAPEKWSNRIALMLSPPPPDHVDLYLSLGNDPQSAGDFARNVLETQDGIHATIDEQYLRLRGFPTVNRGSAYRLWVVDRSGLERNLRVSLYAIPNPVGNLDQNRGEPLEPGRVIEFPEEELSQTLLLELSPEKLAAMAPLLQTSVESKADKLWGGEYDEFDDSFRRHAIPLVFSKPSAEAGAATQPAADKELPGWPVHDGVLCLIEEVDAEGNVVTDPSRDKVNGEDAPKTWWKWLGVGARFPAGDYVDVETFYEYSTRKIVAKVSADPADLVRLGIKKGVQVTATCRPFGNTNARYADAVEQVRELIAAQPAKEFTWQLAEVPQAGDMHLVEFSIDGYRRNVVYQVRTEPNREENVPGELHDQERVRLTRVTFWDRQGTQLPPTSPSEEFVLSKEVRNEAGDWLPLIYDRMEVDVEVDAPGEFDNLSSANPDQIQVGVWPLDAEADAPPASEVEVRYADRRVFTWMAVGNDGLLNVWSSVADHRVVIDKIGDLQSGKYELRSFLKLDEQIVPDPEGVQRLTVDREPPLPGEIRRAATEGDSNVVAKDQPLTVELAARDRLSDVVDVEFRIDGRDTDSELGAEFDRDRGVKLPLDGVIESDGVWTIVIPGDVLKTLPKGKDYFVVAQVIDAAGNRQTRYKPYRFRVSSMAKLPEAEKPVEFQVQPIVNGNTLARVKPLDNGVSITVGGEPPERSASGSYYFRMKKGKYPVKIQVKFRTATYVTPDDYELDVSGKGPYKVRLEKK